MTRCDYDTIFQRVLCITLIGIAFTFTVILTSVFVDIDGLLSRKNKELPAKPFDNFEPVLKNDGRGIIPPNAIAPPKYHRLETFEEQNDDNYRSKRSLESQNFRFHVTNPKVKSILTSRLATLLEELDDEETTVDEKQDRPTREKEVEDMTKPISPDLNSIDSYKEGKESRDSKTEEDLLHLAMHNILLQGIIGHMDLNEVYRKVHLLINNFKKMDIIEDKKQQLSRKQAKPLKQMLNEILEHDENQKSIVNVDDKVRTQTLGIVENKLKLSDKPTVEENKFITEMSNCDKLKTDIKTVRNEKVNLRIVDKEKAPPLPDVLIKTIIDITSLNKDKSHKHVNSDSKERVKGIIQLIYNGKAIRFSRMDEDSKENKRFAENTAVSVYDMPTKTYGNKSLNVAALTDAIDMLKGNNQNGRRSDTYLKDLFEEFSEPSKISNLLRSIETRHKYKRHKRQIKARYQNSEEKKKEVKPKKISLAKTDDDELYVEIETHFDSKGMKGEKKKKLIRNLIDKIQKAINSDMDLFTDNKKKKHRRYHVKKRTQNPLVENTTLFINKVMIPFNNIVQRHSDPISKTSPTSQQDQVVSSITDKSGGGWKRVYPGPGFLTISKSVNSAELGLVNIDYSKVIPIDNIPQRLQKPLNIDSNEEMTNSNSYFDMGNLKLLIKDLDGTGLSIGFSQYTDEPPDPETMKLFTGIEQLVTNYHQSDDQITKDGHDDENVPVASKEKETHDIIKREVAGDNNQHVVIRRSIKELNKGDYHSNEYKITFDSKFLPYDNYEEVIENDNKRIAIKINKDNNNIAKLPILLGDDIFYKKLKPAEILNLASIFKRKKRSVNVKKITNLKNKIKLSKYINRRARFSPEKLILNKKRSKRELDKIRIIATDGRLGKSRHARRSEENILLVSDENLFTDRAMIKEVETPEVTTGQMVIGTNNFENIEEYVPSIYQDTHILQPFDKIYRTNPLMSRYPHIIMEETSNEEMNPFLINKLEFKSPIQNGFVDHPIEPNTEAYKVTDIPNFEEIVGALEQPNEPKQNYKLTVKIMPRNITGTNLAPSFKEIHTSINKSYNRNGMLYSSLYNVSELSKIENLSHGIVTPSKLIDITTNPMFSKQMEDQHTKIDDLLKQHKKRIDDQLEHLKKEREKIEKLSIKNIQTKETSDGNINRTLPLIKFDISQLIALMKLQLQSVGTTMPSTTVSTTQPISTTPSYMDGEKTKIVNIIRRNENLTNEILQQINKNTEILQTFLSKLSDRLVQKSERRKDATIDTEEDKLKLEVSDRSWTPFNLKMPYANPEVNNDTHPAIPFVYAFQRPYQEQRKSPNAPIASVVYYGHIHTSTIREPKESTSNQTKYFIDDVGNNYKDVTIRNEGDKLDPLTFKNTNNNITLT